MNLLFLLFGDDVIYGLVLCFLVDSGGFDYNMVGFGCLWEIYCEN